MAEFKLYTQENRAYQGILTLTEGQQSIEGNKTPLSIKVQLTSGTYTFKTYAVGYEVKVDGVSVLYKTNSGDQLDLSAGQTITLATGQTTVTHADDGTKKDMSVSFRVWMKKGPTYLPTADLVCSGTVSLTTIPRASAPTVSASSIELGQPVTISTNRASAAFTHTLTCDFGSGKGIEIKTGVGVSFVWTPSVDMARYIPSATSGECVITCKTYSGSAPIGTKTCKVTLKVPASVVPTISAFTADRVDNGVPAAWGVYVQGYSKARLKTTAAGAQGSTIKSYTITGGLNGADVTTGALSKSGDNVFAVVVTDSRGRTARKTVTVTVQPYDSPVLDHVSLYRCGSDGAASSSGTSLYAKAAAGISSLGGKNTASMKVEYSSISGSALGSASLTSGAGKVCFAGSLAITSSYIAIITLVDGLGNTASYTTIIRTDKMDFNILDGGGGAAFGGYAEVPDCLDVKWNGLRMGGADFAKTQEVNGAKGTDIFPRRIYSQYGSTVHSSTGTSGQNGYIKIATIEIISRYCNGPIRIVYTQRSHDIHELTIRFTSNDAAEATELSVFLDDSTFGTTAFLHKSAAGVFDLYIRKSEAWDRVDILDIQMGRYAYEHLNITWGNGQVSYPPDGFVAAGRPYKLDAYPVGAIYIAYDGVSPASHFGGTWARMSGYFLWAVSDLAAIGTTGGEREHVLTLDEMPRHGHRVFKAAGSDQVYYFSGAGAPGNFNNYMSTSNEGNSVAHNNMPPYINVAVWRRTG